MAGCEAKHVVLGLVSERSGYGYDLQHRLDTDFDFLGFSERAVYKAIDTLLRDGMVEEVGSKRVGRTRRGAPKRMYRATERGRAELQSWIVASCELTVPREEIHVKLVLAQAPSLPRLLEVVDELEATCLSALRELQERPAPPLDELADPETSWRAASRALVDDAEAIRLQGVLDWLHHVRLVVRRRLERLGGRTGGGARP